MIEDEYYFKRNLENYFILQKILNKCTSEGKCQWLSQKNVLGVQAPQVQKKKKNTWKICTIKEEL